MQDFSQRILQARFVRRHILKIFIVVVFVFTLILYAQHDSLSEQQAWEEGNDSDVLQLHEQKSKGISKLNGRKRPREGSGISKTSNPDISVVVLATSKQMVLTKNCIRALQVHTPSVANVEVIVVDVAPYDFHRRNALSESMRVVDIDKVPTKLLFLNDSRRDYPHNQHLSAAINYGAHQARGKYIVFITDSTEVLPDTLDTIFYELNNMQSDVGVIGNLLIAPDNTIVHAGMDFIMSRKNRYSSSQNTPFVYKRYAGYSLTDRRALTKQNVLAVSIDFLATTKQIFNSFGGINETFGDEYSVLDFCLRMKDAGKHVVYTPDSTALNYEVAVEEDVYSFSFNEDVPASIFSQRWGTKIEDLIQEQYIVKNLTLRWSMECGAGQTLGFTTEALYFILGLKSKVDVKIELSDVNKCQGEMRRIGLPQSVQQNVIRLSNKAIPASRPNILVVHRDPGRYSAFINQVDHPISYIVGRSMYETDRIPEDWVAPCNEVVQEIWLPSQFNMETFAKSGVNKEKLFKVPEPLDIYTYTPDDIGTFYGPCRLKKVAQWLPQGEKMTEPLTLPNKKGFLFLSVMKWEKRKGWDVLLRAYLEEFTANDDVTLYLRSHLDSNNLEQFNNFTKHTKEQIKQLYPRKTFPPTPEIIDNLLPYLGMRSLYKAVDCVVQPSRGEGWGLPIIEAMAMGLPVIATNWSGNTEFMAKNNAYLLNVKELTNATVAGHYWAEPSLSHLRALMRRVYKDRKESEQTGQAAKKFVQQNFSQDNVADLVIGHLLRIKHKLETSTHQTTQQTTQQTNTLQNTQQNALQNTQLQSAHVSSMKETPPPILVERRKTGMKINP